MIPRSEVIETIVDDNEITFSIKPNTCVIGVMMLPLLNLIMLTKFIREPSIGIIVKNLCKNIDPTNINKYILGHIIANNISVSVKQDFQVISYTPIVLILRVRLRYWIVVDNELEPNRLTVKTYKNNDIQTKYDSKNKLEFIRRDSF